MGQAIFLCETRGGAPSQPLLGVVAASLCRSSSKPCRKTFAYLRLGEGASALCSFPCRCVCVFVVLPPGPSPPLPLMAQVLHSAWGPFSSCISSCPLLQS